MPAVFIVSLLYIVEFRKIVAKALNDIQDTTNNLGKYAETWEILQREVELQRNNLHKVTLRYDAGYSDLYSLYEALDLNSTAQIELESSRQQMMTNIIALLKAIGG